MGRKMVDLMVIEQTRYVQLRVRSGFGSGYRGKQEIRFGRHTKMVRGEIKLEGR